MTLPEGQWHICVNAEDAGTASLGTAEGQVTVESISAMVLVKGEVGTEAQAETQRVSMLPEILGAVFAFVVCNLVFARIRKKQKNKKED